MHSEVIIYTDGGSRGNPGPAAGGYVIYDKDKNIITAKGIYIGISTNNAAEYTGLIKALENARSLNARRVRVFSDSDLMVKQVNGIYRVKSPNLIDLHAKVKDLAAEFEFFSIEHVYRNSNKYADQMVNDSLDAEADIEKTPSAPIKQRPPLRIGILLSGGGTTMVNLHKYINSGRLNARIASVISSRSDVKGVDRAKAFGYEPAVIRRKDYDNIDAFSTEIAETLRKAEVELVIQAGWLCLWKIYEDFENRVMNIHPALLPSFGGKGMWGHHVHEAVLHAGCKISGCTVHFCTNEYDKGPIIVQRSCPAYDTDTPETLAARVFKEECIAYPEAIRLFIENKINIVDGIVKITR